MISLRAMGPHDRSAVAEVWHEGWHDAHAAHFPDALINARGPDAFAAAVSRMSRPVTVAEVAGDVPGFVIVDDDTVDRLFVARRARGTGVAQALLRAAENEIAKAGYPTGYLDYVDGNARAARFYEKEGWRVVKRGLDTIELPNGGEAAYTQVICA
ncbi:MAG: GNAT family N-acetyltransferase, partial [Pseudomonadota bacterium]